MKLKYIFLVHLIFLFACEETQENRQNQVKTLSQEELDDAEIFLGFEETNAISKDSVFILSLGGYNSEAIPNLPEKLLEYPYLQSLFITNCSLQELNPNILKKLVNLQELYLYDNELKKLPKEIGELKHLTYLDIQGNDIAEFLKEMTQLKKLKEIRINYTPISEASLKMMLEAIPGITINGIEHVVVDSMYFARTEEQWIQLMDSIHAE